MFWWGVMEADAVQGQFCERRLDERVVRIGTFCGTQQDIRVDQTRGDGHLVVILIDPFPRYFFGHGRNLVRKLG